MARERRPIAVRDVRAELAEKLRARAAEYDIAAYGAPHGCRVADRLDAGEAVELPGWQIPHAARGGFGPNDRLELLPDGSVRSAASPGVASRR